MDCNNTVTILKTSSLNNRTPLKRVTSEIGEFIFPVANNDACYFKLPIPCDTTFCGLEEHLAVKINTGVELEFCEFKQG